MWIHNNNNNELSRKPLGKIVEKYGKNYIYQDNKPKSTALYLTVKSQLDKVNTNNVQFPEMAHSGHDLPYCIFPYPSEYRSTYRLR